MSLLVLVVESMTTSATAQSSYGINASVATLFSRTDIRSLPGIPSCCPKYTTGSGVELGLLGTLGLGDVDRGRFTVGVGMRYRTSSLIARESTLLDADGGRTSKEGAFIHDLAIRSWGLVARSVYEMKFGPVLFGAGADLELTAGMNFDQSEKVETPGYVFTENGLRTRNIRSGSTTGYSAFTPAVTLLAGVPILMGNGDVVLESKVFVRHMLTSALEVGSLRNTAVGLDISLLLPRGRKDSPFPADTVNVLPIDTLPMITKVPEPRVTPKIANIRAIMIDSSGREIPSGRLVITNDIATNMYTMLTYVFFDEDSSDIPIRYDRLDRVSAQAFDIAMLEGKGTIPVYRNMLNVIGARLRTLPNTKIVVTGCVDRREIDRGAKNLARRRAERVRDYFVDVFGIASDRISIVSRGMPDVPSNSTSEDGAAENRRVEITSNTWEVLEPVSYQDTTRFTTYSDTLRVPVAPRITLIGDYIDAEDSQWSFDLRQGNQTLQSFSGHGVPPDSIVWDIGSDVESVPRTDEDVTFHIVFRYRDTVQNDTSGSLFTVEQRTTRHRSVERFSLIIFGYNESAVSSANERILNYISSRIRENSVVRVDGYTDRSGDDEYNRKLSQRRAEAIAKRLGVPRERIQGHGSDEQLYPNDLPEGRLYCRTVRVTVETPTP